VSASLNSASERQAVGEGIFSWLTLEQLGYACLVLVGLGIRFARLGFWPLTEAEAWNALAAWRATLGDAWRPAAYSPLIFGVAWPLFALTKSSEFALRLFSAAVGGALPLLAYAAREEMGRRGALAAAVMLALGPSWVYYSRIADGTILSAAAGILLWLCVVRWRSARLTGLTLGLGVAAGTGVYASVLFVMWLWIVERRRPRFEGEDLGVIARWFLGTLTVAATAGGLNLGGLAAVGESAGQWVLSLSPFRAQLPWYHGLRLLANYELLTLILAVWGAISAWKSGEHAKRATVLWAAGALVGHTLLGHRSSTQFLDLLVPLTILAAWGVEDVWPELGSFSDFEWVAFLAGLVMVGFVFLNVASYTYMKQIGFIYRAVLGAILLLAGALSLSRYRSIRSAIAVGGLLVMVCLFIFTVRTTTALAYQTGRDPREAIVPTAGSVELRLLSEDVAALGYRMVGDPTSLDIVYEERLGPWIPWILRHYRARSVVRIAPEPMADLLVTGPYEEGSWPRGYVGERFALRQSWPKQTVTWARRFRWLFYREPMGQVENQDVQLWAKITQ